MTNPVTRLGWWVVDRLVGLVAWLRVDRLGSALPYVLLIPALIAVGIFVAGLLTLAWRAFHSFDPFTATEGGWSLDQFAALFTPPSAQLNADALARTFAVAVTVTLAALIVALPVAYIAVRVRTRGMRALIFIALLAPFLMGEAPRAFGWSLILGQQGALASFLRMFGLESPGLLGTVWATWIGLLQLSISLATFVMLPAVRRIDPTIERAAQTLGARPFEIWRRIIVPLSAPGLAAAGAIVFLINVAEFDLPQVVGLGRVPFASNLIQAIYSQQANVNLGAAFSLLLLGMSTAALLLVVLVWRVAAGVSARRQAVLVAATERAPHAEEAS